KRPSRKFRSPGKLFTREVAVSITPLHPIPIPRIGEFACPNTRCTKSCSAVLHGARKELRGQPSRQCERRQPYVLRTCDERLARSESHSDRSDSESRRTMCRSDCAR